LFGPLLLAISLHRLSRASQDNWKSRKRIHAVK
jgi:hypothetical protein